MCFWKVWKRHWNWVDKEKGNEKVCTRYLYLIRFLQRENWRKERPKPATKQHEKRCNKKEISFQVRFTASDCK